MENLDPLAQAPDTLHLLGPVLGLLADGGFLVTCLPTQAALLLPHQGQVDPITAHLYLLSLWLGLGAPSGLQGQDHRSWQSPSLGPLL